MKENTEQTTATNANPILNVDKDGCVLYSNEAGTPILVEWGVRVGEKVHSSIVDLVQRVLSLNSPEKIEVKAGTRLYLVVFHPLPEQECVNISGFNISDQKNFEEGTQESEEKYGAVFENSIDAILLTTPDGAIREANPAACKMFMMTEEEIIQAGRDGLTDPSDPRLKSFLEKRARIGKSSGEFNHRRKDGTIFPGEVSSAFFKDKNGTIRTVTIIRDITERKRTEEEVKNTKNMLQLIMNNIPQAIFWKDCNSKFLGCNKVFAEDAGIESPENIVGKTDYDLPWTREQTEWYREYDRRIMKNDTPEYHIIEPQTTADGELTWLDTNKIPLHDAKGNLIGILGTYEDITERKRAEKALRESEEKFRQMAENIGEIFFIFTPDWKQTVYVSPAYEQIWGRSLKDIYDNSMDWLEAVHPDDRMIPLAVVNKYIAGNFMETDTAEYRILRPDGMLRWINARTYPVLDEQGSVYRITGIAEDITQHKVVEQALKKAHDTLEEKVKERTAELEKTYKSLIESEKSLDEAQEMAHLGNWVWDIATDKAYWSNELYRIFGRDPQKLAPTIDEFHSYIHPDDRHDYVNLANKALNEKSSLCVDFRIISDDGEERRVDIQSKIIFNETNDPVQIKGIIRDITESKKAEERIQNLANIVESSEDAIGTLTLDGTIISWNKGAEKVYGYSVEEILGKCVSILAPPHLKDETIRLSEQVKKGEKIRNHETMRQRKDGKMIYVSFSLSPVFDIHEKLTAISFISRDITKRKEAEEALAKIEIARKQEIHHRIKNNLQVISSLLDLQAEKFIGKKNIEESQILEAFKESQDRVISMALIHEELHKGGELNTLNFSSYIKELTDNLFLAYRLGNEGISLDMDLEDDIYFDMDTSVPLGIIINELVSNSLKHAFSGRDNGEIQIKLHKEESCSTIYILSVSDNGNGIPKDIDIENLDSLGLQLVTTLVDQLDGELELNRDNGTEFTVRFSVTEKSDQASETTTKLIE